MDLPKFEIPKKEIKRYDTHGIAHIRLKNIVPIPENGCHVDVAPLNELDQVRFYAVKQVPEAPELILYGSDQKAPKNAVAFSPEKVLDTVAIMYWHNHPNLDYTDVDVVATYKD